MCWFYHVSNKMHKKSPQRRRKFCKSLKDLTLLCTSTTPTCMWRWLDGLDRMVTLFPCKLKVTKMHLNFCTWSFCCKDLVVIKCTGEKCSKRVWHFLSGNVATHWRRPNNMFLKAKQFCLGSWEIILCS